MSLPKSGVDDDGVYSVPEADISERLVEGFTNEWILVEKPCI